MIFENNIHWYLF